MINCRNCKFEVKPSMRHSLIKNCCPACGGALLGELHSRRLALFRQKMSNQPFSERLESDDIFDIALFLLVEFFPPDINLASSEEESDTGAAEAPTETPEDTTSSMLAPEPEEESYEAIRDQVRTEILASNADLPKVLDEDLKVQRLKRIAKESKIRSPGAAVRRISK